MRRAGSSAPAWGKGDRACGGEEINPIGLWGSILKNCGDQSLWACGDQSLWG